MATTGRELSGWAIGCTSSHSGRWDRGIYDDGVSSSEENILLCKLS